MAGSVGPSIVESGLLFVLDIADKNCFNLFNNLITNPSTAASYSANQNVTITQDGQYVKVVSNQNTSTPGAWPIGGTITIKPNTDYFFGIKAKRVSTPTPRFYISTGGNTQIAFTNTTLTSTDSYIWSYIRFNTSATSVKVGFLWSGPLVGSELSVETVTLNEISTKDLVLPGNNYTLVNLNNTFYDLQNGGSIILDGTDDYISVYNTINLGNTFTINAVIKLTSNNSDTVIFGTNANGSDNWFGITTNKLYTYFTEIADVNNNSHTGNTTLSNGTWYYVTLTVNGSTVTFYLNGVLDGTKTVAFTIGSWNGTVDLGRRGGVAQRYFNGNIAFVNGYNRVLSNSEILQNFNAVRSRFGI